MKLALSFDTLDLSGPRQTIARAATDAMHEAADLATVRVRDHIDAAGLGRLSGAFRSTVYPTSGTALDPAASFHFKGGIGDIFETGGVIKGAPLLWLPLSGAKFAGVNRVTPEKFVARGGKLFSVERPGRPPLLGTKIAGKTVLLFVGVPQVTVRKRLNVEAIVAQVATELPALLSKHLQD